MQAMPAFRGRAAAAALAVPALLALYGLGYFFWNEIYLIGGDKYYYMSIADGFLRDGSLKDWTVEPAGRIVTPKIGAAFLYALLFKLGLSRAGAVFFLVFFNFALHVLSVVPLNALMKRAGLAGPGARIAVIAAYLGSWHILRMQLNPINDGIFDAFSLLLVLLIVLGLERGGPRAPWNVPSILVLTVFLSLFEIHGMIILIAGILAGFLTGRFRFSLILSGILLAVSMAVGLYLTRHAGFDFFGQVSGFIEKSMGTVSSRGSVAAGASIPTLMVSRDYVLPRLVSAVTLIALVVSSFSALRRKDAAILFLALACLIGFWFFAPYRFRYLTCFFPLAYIVLFSHRYFRYAGFVFALACLAFTVDQFRDPFYRGQESRYWQYLYHHPVRLEGDRPLLFSPKRYHPYFYLNARTYRNKPDADLLRGRGRFYIVGSRAYRDKQLGRLRDLMPDGARLKSRNMTPGYVNDEGWALMEYLPEKGRT